MDITQIGQVLRSVRRQKNMTLDEAAASLRRVGVRTSRSSLSQLERGTLPSGVVLPSYAELLGVSLAAEQPEQNSCALPN